VLWSSRARPGRSGRLTLAGLSPPLDTHCLDPLVADEKLLGLAICCGLGSPCGWE